LGTGLGFGISSCMFFAWLLAFGSAGKGFLAFEVILTTLLMGCLVLKLRSSANRSGSFSRLDLLTSGSSRYIKIGFYLSLALACVTFVLLSVMSLHGMTDAWGIWNMRARVLAGGGDQLKELFGDASLYWTKPDYPLLLPGIVARFWKGTGNETLLIPMLV